MFYIFHQIYRNIKHCSYTTKKNGITKLPIIIEVAQKSIVFWQNRLSTSTLFQTFFVYNYVLTIFHLFWMVSVFDIRMQIHIRCVVNKFQFSTLDPYTSQTIGIESPLHFITHRNIRARKCKLYFIIYFCKVNYASSGP